MFLTKKTQTSHRWMAWIPVLQFYLLCKIAGKSGWWLTYPFLPIIFFLLIILPIPKPTLLVWIFGLLVGISSLMFFVVLIILWGEIAKRLGRPRWWGILIVFVPVVNLVLMGILAFSKPRVSNQLSNQPMS